MNAHKLRCTCQQTNKPKLGVNTATGMQVHDMGGEAAYLCPRHWISTSQSDSRTHILPTTSTYRELGKNFVLFFFSSCFLIFLSEFQQNKRSLLIQQEGKLTWLIFLSPLGVSKLKWEPGKIPKHCHQRLVLMIMSPGSGSRKSLKFILTHVWRKTNRALFMPPWTILSLE